jgi:hypothetical protein
MPRFSGCSAANASRAVANLQAGHNFAHFRIKSCAAGFQSLCTVQLAWHAGVAETTHLASATVCKGMVDLSQHTDQGALDAGTIASGVDPNSASVRTHGASSSTLAMPLATYRLTPVEQQQIESAESSKADGCLELPAFSSYARHWINQSHLAAGALQSVCTSHTNAQHEVSLVSERSQAEQVRHSEPAVMTGSRTSHAADGGGAGAGEQPVTGAVVSARTIAFAAQFSTPSDHCMCAG